MAKNKGGLTKGQKFTLRILGKYLAPVALCLVVLIAALVFAGSLSSGQEALIVTDDNQIGELRNKLDALDNDIKAMGETDGYSTEWVYSRNDERKAADDAVAEAFFKEYTTWTNGEEYEQKHKALVSACGGYSTSSLVISFLPQQTIYYDENNRGVITVYEQDGYDMRFGSLTSYRVSANGSVTSYVGLVRVERSGSGALTGKTEGSVYVCYDIVNGEFQAPTAQAFPLIG